MPYLGQPGTLIAWSHWDKQSGCPLQEKDGQGPQASGFWVSLTCAQVSVGDLGIPHQS